MKLQFCAVALGTIIQNIRAQLRPCLNQSLPLQPLPQEAQRDLGTIIEAQRDLGAITEAQRDLGAITEAQRG